MEYNYDNGDNGQVWHIVHLGVDDDLDCIGDKNGKCDNDGNDVVDGNDGVGDKMIESVDRNASWDPHVLSCRPPPMQRSRGGRR